MAQIFVLNPKYEAVATGEKPYKASKGFFILQTLFQLVWIVVGIGFFVKITIKPWFYSVHLQEHGVVTQATIVDRLTGKCKDDDGDSHTCYYATYRFEHIEPNGEPREYQNRARISAVESQYMVPETKVNIMYDSVKPTRSWFRDDAPTDFTLLNAVFGSFVSIMFAGVPILMLVGTFKTYSFERKLAKHGQLIRGVVHSCKGETDSDDDFDVTLKYSFWSPDVREITRETTHTANHIDEDTLPSPGTPLAIWYANDRVYDVL